MVTAWYLQVCHGYRVEHSHNSLSLSLFQGNLGNKQQRLLFGVLGLRTGGHGMKSSSQTNVAGGSVGLIGHELYECRLGVPTCVCARHTRPIFVNRNKNRSVQPRTYIFDS